MPEPDKSDHLNWSGLLKVARYQLGISPKEFWQLTFMEYWSLYEVVEPKEDKKKMTSSDVDELQKRFLGGTFRRISS